MPQTSRKTHQNLCPSLLATRVQHYSRLPSHKTQPNPVLVGKKGKEQRNKNQNHGHGGQCLGVYSSPAFHRGERNPEQREARLSQQHDQQCLLGQGLLLALLLKPPPCCLGAAQCPRCQHDVLMSFRSKGGEHGCCRREAPAISGEHRASQLGHTSSGVCGQICCAC